MASKKAKQNNPEESTTSIVGKITAKLVLGDFEIGDRARIGGQAKKFTTKPDAFGGISTCFYGNFAAKLPDNSVVTSKRLYMPKIVEELITEALEKKVGDDVSFHFDLFKVESDKTKQGYAWGVEITKSPEVKAVDTLLLLGVE